MVNLDVDSYAKTLNHRKIIRKTQKSNVLKTKQILKPKYHLRWRSSFHIWMARVAFRPSTSCQLRHWLLCIVFAYSKLSLVYYNKIRDGGVA